MYKTLSRSVKLTKQLSLMYNALKTPTQPVVATAGCPNPSTVQLGVNTVQKSNGRQAALRQRNVPKQISLCVENTSDLPQETILFDAANLVQLLQNWGVPPPGSLPQASTVGPNGGSLVISSPTMSYQGLLNRLNAIDILFHRATVQISNTGTSGVAGQDPDQIQFDNVIELIDGDTFSNTPSVEKTFTPSQYSTSGDFRDTIIHMPFECHIDSAMALKTVVQPHTKLMLRLSVDSIIRRTR